MNHKIIAGWIALAFVLGLALEAAVARWFPLRTSEGSEAIIISGLLAFAAASFGISAYEKVNAGK